MKLQAQWLVGYRVKLFVTLLMETLQYGYDEGRSANAPYYLIPSIFAVFAVGSINQLRSSDSHKQET